MTTLREWFCKFSPKVSAYSALLIFLTLTIFTGGSSRADATSLIILRPVAVIFCGIGLWSIRLDHVRQNQFLFAMATAIFVLVISHLIPLPPAVWGALPGRGIMIQIDKAADLGAVWRPIAMVPSAGWNAFFSLFVPLAVLLLVVQLSGEERSKLLAWLLCFGLLSGFWAIAQISGPPNGPFYLYTGAGDGVAEGLFRNRNHQATLLALLFPMLAVFATGGDGSRATAKLRLWMAIGAGVVLVPLILVTGSRAGLIVGIFGIISIPFLFRRQGISRVEGATKQRLNLRFGVMPLLILCIGGLSIWLSRAEAFSRLIAGSTPSDQRLVFWLPIAHMAETYFPVGSGVGSFVEVYQINEPNELLSPDYLNHAHNDWLEIYLTAGLPGMVLLTIAVVAYLRMSFAAFRAPIASGRSVGCARMASVMIAIFAFTSVADYPLRAPSLMCVFVIAAVWLANSTERKAKIAGIG